MKTVNIPFDLCCGCSACALACPMDAIHMEFNSRGQYRPAINESQCVSCELCVDACSKVHASDTVPELNKEQVYIAVAKNRTVLKRSSSGGIGHVLAKKGIEKGMPVCGVDYDPQLECAAHCVCENADDLSRIQGSKYLQSANFSAFREILHRDAGVVFGTPCQIASAAVYLEKKKKRNHFLLVDIFCHGVPNQLLWKNHLKWIRQRKQIEGNGKPVFRKGKNYLLELENYKAWYNEDAFYTFFLRGWLKNESCYNCQFRRNSLADIRIGDCQVEKYKDLPYSPSCILVNTERGKMYIEACRKNLDIYPEEYSVIDGIQEKENIAIPANYEERVKALQNGEPPENLIRKTMVLGRVKSLIKHGILDKVIKMDRSHGIMDLTDLE